MSVALLTTLLGLITPSLAIGPCDIYEAAGTPCVAAHSTVRALYDAYNGPLYLLNRSSDHQTLAIGLISPGGSANAKAHESFCATDEPASYSQISTNQECEQSSRIPAPCAGCGPNWGNLSQCQALCDRFSNCHYVTFFEDNGCRLYSSCDAPVPNPNPSVPTDTYKRKGFGCSIDVIYDQSPRGNHLTTAPAGGAGRQPDVGVSASKGKITMGGHTVYGAYFEGGMGYRNDKTSGVATGDNAESMYMVTAGKHYNDKCCFDYGNAETDNDDDGAGTMEAIYFGSCSGWGHGAGAGPWVMADLENGLWAGAEKSNPGNHPIDADFVTAMVKGRPGGFNLKGGDAQGGRLQGLYEGKRPAGYDPMKKQGAIILGIGGDNSDWAIGTFYEGVMTAGYSDDMTDDAIQANIVAAGYGK